MISNRHGASEITAGLKAVSNWAVSVIFLARMPKDVARPVKSMDGSRKFMPIY